MASELKSLRKAFVEAVESSDRYPLTRALVNDAFVRGLVYDIVQFYVSPEFRTPNRLALEHILNRVACRLGDADDVVERLSEARSDARFRFELGEFIRDTARNTLRPVARTAPVSTNKSIASILVSSGSDDVFNPVAVIETLAASLATRW
jgi:hypothetical protein